MDGDAGRERGSKPATRRKPRCRLVGIDGNVFSMIGNVRRTLADAGEADLAADFVKRAFASRSYDEVLALCFEYVDVR